MGRSCIATTLDIANPQSVEDFCRQIIADFGKVDVLVNNAGVYLDQGKFADSDLTRGGRRRSISVVPI